MCHKHRNIRRENVLRVRALKSWQRCLFFIVDSGAPACIQHQSRRFIFCGHRSKAGYLSANQVMPVQLRLTAPKMVVNTAGASSAAESPKLFGSGAAPERRATAFHFQNRLRGSQVGRQRPHKPSMSGFDSRLRYHFQSHSRQQRAARSVRRSLALQARERGAKPRRSTIFQTREGWESTESHKLCHRGSSPRPATISCGGSSLKTRTGL